MGSEMDSEMTSAVDSEMDSKMDPEVVVSDLFIEGRNGGRVEWDPDSYSPLLPNIPDRVVDVESSRVSSWIAEQKSSNNWEIIIHNGISESNDPSISYSIEKRTFKAGELDLFSLKGKWISNLVSKPATETMQTYARISWLDVYKNDETWDQLVFHCEPKDKYNISSKILAEEYVFWIESDPYSDPYQPDWLLYGANLINGEIELIADSDRYPLKTMPFIQVFEDRVFIGFHYIAGYGEVFEYDCKAHSFRHLYFKDCVGYDGYGIVMFNGILTSFDHDGTHVNALTYNVRTGEAAKYILPLKSKAEFIYYAFCLGEWLVYSSNLGLTYGYHPLTDEWKVIADTSNIVPLNDHTLLLMNRGCYLVLYDTLTDKYRTIQEVNIDYYGGNSTFIHDRGFFADNFFCMYEAERNLEEYPVYIITANS